jgi:hypothetical protein
VRRIRDVAVSLCQRGGKRGRALTLKPFASLSVNISNYFCQVNVRRASQGANQFEPIQ